MFRDVPRRPIQRHQGLATLDGAGPCTCRGDRLKRISEEAIRANGPAGAALLASPHLWKSASIGGQADCFTRRPTAFAGGEVGGDLAVPVGVPAARESDRGSLEVRR